MSTPEKQLGKLSVSDFAKSVRQKYNAYDDVDDVTLARKVAHKFPEYSGQVDWGEPQSNDPKELIDHYSAVHGVDPDLVYRLTGQESRFKGNAVSPKGAQGLMQLMPDTGRAMGVRNPFDPKQNINGGIKYLRQQLDEFGSPDLALAAYNAGPGAVRKHKGIPPYRETQNYVKTILRGYTPPDRTVPSVEDVPTQPTGGFKGGEIVNVPSKARVRGQKYSTVQVKARPGDTPESLAERFNVSPSELTVASGQMPAPRVQPPVVNQSPDSMVDPTQLTRPRYAAGDPNRTDEFAPAPQSVLDAMRQPNAISEVSDAAAAVNARKMALERAARQRQAVLRQRQIAQQRPRTLEQSVPGLGAVEQMLPRKITNVADLKRGDEAAIANSRIPVGAKQQIDEQLAQQENQLREQIKQQLVDKYPLRPINDQIVDEVIQRQRQDALSEKEASIADTIGAVIGLGRPAISGDLIPTTGGPTAVQTGFGETGNRLVQEGVARSVGGTLEQLGNLTQSPGQQLTRTNPLRSAGRVVGTGVQKSITEHPSTSTLGQIRDEVVRGVAGLPIEYGKLAAGAPLGALNLPLQGALSADQNDPGAVATAALKGLGYHYGMQATAPLGRVLNTAVWTAVPTVEGVMEGKSVAEVLGSALPMGLLAATGPKGTEAREQFFRKRGFEPIVIKSESGETASVYVNPETGWAVSHKVRGEESRPNRPVVEVGKEVFNNITGGRRINIVKGSRPAEPVQTEPAGLPAAPPDTQPPVEPVAPTPSAPTGLATIGEQLKAKGVEIPATEPQLASNATLPVDAAAGVETSPQAAQTPKKYRHLDFGDVTEAENQKGVPEGSVRVFEDKNPSAEHIILRSNGRGQGNNRAIPVRGENVGRENAGQVEGNAESGVLPVLQRGGSLPVVGEGQNAEALALNGRQARQEAQSTEGQLSSADVGSPPDYEASFSQSLKSIPDKELRQMAVNDVSASRAGDDKATRRAELIANEEERRIREGISTSTLKSIQSPKGIIEQAGLKYLGEQETGKGKPPAHLFNTPDGSTLMIKGEVTPESVRAKVEAHQERLQGQEKQAEGVKATPPAAAPLSKAVAPETSKIRATFDDLQRQSDEAYQRASAAMRAKDRPAYEAATKESHDLANQAQKYFEKLPPEEQKQIKTQSLGGLMEGMMRLGRTPKQEVATGRTEQQTTSAVPAVKINAVAPEKLERGRPRSEDELTFAALNSPTRKAAVAKAVQDIRSKGGEVSRRLMNAMVDSSIKDEVARLKEQETAPKVEPIYRRMKDSPTPLTDARRDQATRQGRVIRKPVDDVTKGEVRAASRIAMKDRGEPLRSAGWGGRSELINLRLEGGKTVKVYKNPTPEDFAELGRAFRDAYPNAPRGEPQTRFTRDAEGNVYRWMSGDAVHFQLEPALKEAIGAGVNQNMPLAKFNAKLEKLATTASIPEIARGAKWTATRPNELEVNEEAYLLLHGALGNMADARGESFGGFSGVFADPRVASQLVSTMTSASRRYGREGRKIYELAQAISKAAKQHKGVVLYTDKGSLLEERHHQASYRAAEQGGETGLEARHAHFDELYNSPVMQKARPYLVESYADKPALLVEELAPKLADGLHADYGLTSTEAADWLHLFYRSLAEKNGIESLQHFEEIEDATERSIEAIKSARRRVQSVSGEQGQIRAGAERGSEKASGREGQEVLAKRLSGQKGLVTDPQTRTENFKRWFDGSKVVDDKGNPLVVYSGHQNAEMYGNAFDPKKATAGGFYASEDPQVASNYSISKLGNKEYFEDGGQYRFKLKNGEWGKKLWQMELTPEQQAIARDFINHNDEGEKRYDVEGYWRENARYDADARRALARGGLRDLQSIYKFLENMGDNIAYASEGDAPYFQRQNKGDFEQLLDKLGIPWQSYDWSQPGVMPVYLSIKNPIDADKPFPPDVLAALKQAARYERTSPDAGMDSQWTTEYPLKEWIKDIESGNEYWTTQIPKKALPILKRFGYDGFKERGLKGSDLPREQRQINWIAFDPGQIKSASGNRGTFDPTDPNILRKSDKSSDAISSFRLIPEESAPTFYSQLERTISAKMSNRMSAAQLRSLINNPQSGVKPDEVKWSGLDDFLQGKETVSKSEVLDYLKANNVKVEEVVKGAGNPEIERRLEEINDEMQVLSDEYYDLNQTRKQWALGEDVENPESADFIERVRRNRDAMHAFEDERAKLKAEAHQASATKFSQYTLPGAKEGSYRELLLTLPENRPEISIGGFAKYRWGADSLNDLSAEKQTALRAEYEQRKAAGTLPRVDGASDTYRSSHFDEPNILAHIRFNDRTDADGKRVMFLEEVQSDAHQEGRKKGYKNPDLQRELDAAKAEADKAVKASSEAIFDVQVATAEGGLRALARAQAERERLSKIAQEAIARREEVRARFAANQNAVPDLPFKKTWHELAIRRALRYAAENGYDKVAWTTGEQQAERYDLSKKVDAVHWQESTGELYIKEKGKELTATPVARNVTKTNLDDYVGKEAAEKLLAQRPDENEYRSLEGVDLKVGGEGMKGFYDRILPSYLNKYGRKWGARVGKAKIEVSAHSSQNDAIHDIPKSVETVHSIDITEQMRRSVLDEGQPLFKRDSSHKPQSIGELSDDFFGGGKTARPLLNAMNAGVVAALHHNQVVKAVVEALPVNVVNTLSSNGINPEAFVGKPKMFTDRLPVETRRTVAFGLSNALSKVGASLRAGLNAVYKTGLDKEILPALRASDLSFDESVGILSYKSGVSSGNAVSPSVGAGLTAESPMRGVGALVAKDKLDAAELANLRRKHEAIIARSRDDITPPMQKSVMEGQPLFKREARERRGEAGFINIGDISKVVKENALDMINVPRTIMASADLSAAGRQGLILTLTHPLLATRAMAEQFKSLVSQKKYDQLGSWLANHPEHQLAEDSGLYLSILQKAKGEAVTLAAQAKATQLRAQGKPVPKRTELRGREEAFMSRLASRLPIVKQSERAYVAYLDKIRMDAFTKYVETLRKRGVTSEKAFKDVAHFVNAATGRGDLGESLNSITPMLNAVFFSPRYLASRVELLNPATYLKMEPGARRIAMTKMIQFAGLIGLTLLLSKLGGADVETNPESSDWLKIKSGNTRYDMLAGFQQPMRFVYRMTKGLVKNARGVPDEKENPAEITKQFLRNKLSPTASYVVDWMTGTTQQYDEKGKREKFTITRGIYNRLVPMVANDFWEAYKQEGMRGVAKATPSFFGIGTQTYSSNQTPRIPVPSIRRPRLAR